MKLRNDKRSIVGSLVSFFFPDNSAAAAEHAQGPEKQGGPVAGAAVARPPVSVPAQSAKKPGKP